VLLLLAACGGTDVSQLTGPDGVRCVTAITGAPPSLPAAASQASVVVSTERECSWSATSSTSWLTVSPATGQGEATLTLTVATNGSNSSRSATLVVNEARITLTQAGATQTPAPPSSSVTFNGSISNLVGFCPILTFNAGGRQVVTDANTRFSGGSCSSLRNGRSVEIEAEPISGNLVRATRVRL
jgi:hypothetical protein